MIDVSIDDCIELSIVTLDVECILYGLCLRGLDAESGQQQRQQIQ